MSNNCLFYDKNIQKKVPVLLNSQKLFYINGNYYVKVSFDSTRYTQYNTTRDELLRYSKETIKLMEIYPAITQQQLDYADDVLPKKFAKSYSSYLTTSTHQVDELTRFESVIYMITNGGIDYNVFENLINFVFYELYLFYCNTTERSFIDSLSATQLSQQPSVVYVPQIIRILKNIFANFDISINNIDRWKIINFKEISEFDSLTPFIIFLTNLKYNAEFIVV